MGSNNVNIPNFAACQYGEQELNAKYGTSQSKDKDVKGLLKRNQLEPLKLIFSNEYTPRLPERAFGNMVSKITSQV